MNEQLQFTLDRNPLTQDEISIFSQNIHELELDEQVLHLLNRLPLTQSKFSIPKILRAYAEDTLMGVAWIIECRKSMGQILPGWLGKFMDMPEMPIFFWGRCDVTIDSFNNPGFVSGQLSLSYFFEQAIQFLTKRYMNGIVITKPNDIQLPWRLASSFVDSGYIHIGENTYEHHLSLHQNLRRKLNKFTNKGGNIEVCHGGLYPDRLKELSICLSNSEQHAKANLGFQDIYNPLAIGNLAAERLKTVHFIAHMEKEIVGYHSFLQSGNTLHCLSGGFKRNTQSNYHAYENIIMESIRYAAVNNYKNIHYGPVFNRTKALMMQTFEKTELHFYTRHSWLRKGIPFIINKSRINPKLLHEYIIDIHSEK